MKLTNKLTLATSMGLILTSSVAFSGSTFDTFNYYCQYCAQITQPNPVCMAVPEVPELVIICGSESWDRSGTLECKRFLKHFRKCSWGGTMTYTTEEWAGAGSTCQPSGDNSEMECH